MDKMRMESVDMTSQNIEKIEALFPNCVTETIDADGKAKKAINFEMLRQMLSSDMIEGDEAYEFTWVGKKAAIVEANKPIRKTLRPCPEESVNWDSTENLYIEGDNLEVLKLLQESYLGAIKLIYIDPPYNTGNDFVYRDDFKISEEEYEEEIGVFDEEGGRLFRNSDTNGRFHSVWCSMIYSRLIVARNLLSADGVIFISIDDNEAANLIKICDEVFGRSCFVADISWQRTYAPRNDSKGISNEKEHIVVYSAQPDWRPNKLPRTEEMNSKYSNPDNDFSDWRTDNAFAPGAITHQGMVYAIQNPFTGEFIYPGTARCWTFGQEQAIEIMRGWGNYELKDLHDEEQRAQVCGISPSDVRQGVKGIVLVDPLEVAKEKATKVLKEGPWPKYYFTKSGYGGIAKKTYLDQVGGKAPTNQWLCSDVGHTDEAKKEIMELFDSKAPFDTPKPIRLMERILTIASNEDSLVLDFFSGSATMAHAVMKKNDEDGGNRRFIMIQLPEATSAPGYNTLCDIGIERIKRAGKRILDNNPDSKSDIGIRVLKLDDTNMRDVYYSADDYDQNMLAMLESNIKEDRTDLDLLFGCLLEWGLPLSLPYTSETIDGFTVHTYNDGDLIACFDENISKNVIETIAKRKPLRAVFRDSSFASSPAKINVEEIFKLLAPDTRVKVI